MIGAAFPGRTGADPRSRQHIRIAVIAVSALGACAITAFCLLRNISVVFPHLFYIPIVTAAYWYPRRGLAAGALLALAYLAEVLLLLAPVPGEILSAVVRSVIFIGIAAVVAYLSGSLQKQESRYHGIFDNSEAGIFLFDPGTCRIEEMNQRCGEILGVSPEDVQGRLITEIWSEFKGAPLERITGGERVATLEVGVTRGEGEDRTVLVSANLLPDQRVVCTVITDVTARRQMTDRLERSEEKTRAILESVDTGIVVTDLADRIVDANEAALRIYGCTGREALVGKSPMVFVAEREHTRALLSRERILREGHIPPLECTLARGDGSEFLAEVTATVLRDGAGQPAGLVQVIRDITDQHRKEEEIRERNRQLSIINEIIGTASASRDLDGMLHAALDRTLDLLNFDTGAIYIVNTPDGTASLRSRQGIGDPAMEPPAVVEIGAPLFADVLVAGVPHYVDSFHERYPGYRHSPIRSFAAVPILDDGRLVGCFAIADMGRTIITPEERAVLEAIGKEIGSGVTRGLLQEELEAALARANRYLEEANAANDEANLYIDILSHDVNNANAAAIGYTQVLIELADNSAKKFAQKALTAIQQSSEIIRNVTTLRKLRHEETLLIPIKLDSAIRDVLNYFSDATIAYGGSDATVLADDLIDEIFTNLIGNSLKFGGPEVGITIRVEEREDEVSVTVEDTGPGIPDDLKSRIFQRYQRGTTRKSGKGLGLYITRMLVERYGGRISAHDRVEGRPGEGAAVTFTLRRYVQNRT
ncbi:sensor histidine kinase [Methanoculleus taiwanensis]|uniref:sensor histidine kinase n=1 Tax=Methanoculleus taiwanensis TaxID=1550565 RepID=UPI000FFF088A|nr:PAS domain S-box protein [Methanoculleus taiwanensis]